jgi:hypothetical protein
MSDREKLANFMLANGFATGHGDTIDDLITELTWQIKEERRAAKERERKALKAVGRKTLPIR